MNFVAVREAQNKAAGLSRFQRWRMRLGKKIPIGKETREGWPGYLMFHLFWCLNCGHYAKDYPHGFIQKRYLTCSFCGIQHDFVPWRAFLVPIYYFLKWQLTGQPIIGEAEK